MNSIQQLRTGIRYIPAFILFFFMSTLYAQHNAVAPTDGFIVSGIVKNTLKLNIKDLLRLKQDDLGDVAIKNQRGEEKGVAKQIKGVSLKAILDSAEIFADKPKEFSEFYIVLTASDEYTNVYSWNELYNTEVGKHVYVVTEMDGKSIDQMPDRILVLSLADLNSGRRHLKGLAKIEVKKVN